MTGSEWQTKCGGTINVYLGDEREIIEDLIACERERDNMKQYFDMFPMALESRCRRAEARAEKAEREREGFENAYEIQKAHNLRTAARIRYYEDTLCCETRIMLEKGGETKAIDTKKVGDLVARLAKMREAWKRYGNHDDDCDVCHPVHGPECSCGYDETCAALADASEEENDGQS